MEGEGRGRARGAVCVDLRVHARRPPQVEIEALQEQLRVRKTKQYHLLEKSQGAEEAKRQAEDQVGAMEEKLRQLHAKTVELETQLQVRAAAAAVVVSVFVCFGGGVLLHGRIWWCWWRCWYRRRRSRGRCSNLVIVQQSCH